MFNTGLSHAIVVGEDRLCGISVGAGEKMSENISLFSGYNSAENRTTNYCLLVLKTLYENNPKYLAEVLSALLGENLGDLVGVTFRQQERKKSSVPDGLISQRAFTIFIEAKSWDWFYDSQLEAHLEALDAENPGVKVLIALGNFDNSATDRFDRIAALCAEKYRKCIAFAALSFEDLLSACEDLAGLSKNLADMLADFRLYLTQRGLLSSWERLLDVVNCAGFPQEVIDGNVYLCPATGGNYNHSRSKFFGMYRNKRVERVAVIEAVVDLESPDTARLRWKNTKGHDADFISLARAKHGKWRAGDYPTRVFLLSPLEETAFQKTSKGGMQQSRRYFDVGALAATDAKDLATKLRDRPWPINTGIVTV
jgi:hypothetical protein